MIFSENRYPLFRIMLYCASSCFNFGQRRCAELAKPSGVVLLAPACASFDMFKDYAERGHRFKEEVKRLVDATSG